MPEYRATVGSMLNQLDSEERMRLMKFVCSFAWADLDVKPEERILVSRILERMELDPGEEKAVHGWLDVPPPPHEVDPTDIPRGHRELFIAAARAVIESDGEIQEEERELMALFTELLD